MIAVSAFARAWANAPAEVLTLRWEDFAASVQTQCETESPTDDKRALLALGPYRLRDGATRSADAVACMSRVVALDVDSLTPEGLDRLCLKLRELRLDAVVHGSPGDHPPLARRKVRVYVRADAEHAPSEAGVVRAALAAQLGVEFDGNTTNADRLFFLGRLRGTPARFFWQSSGAPLALASLPRPVVTASPVPTPAPDRAGDAAFTAAACAILGALGPAGAWQGSKHALCGALGGVLRKASVWGWTEEDCAALIRAWLPAGDPSVDVEHGVRWACTAFRKDESEVSGGAALAAVVGTRIAHVIREAVAIPWNAKQTVAPADAPAPSSYAVIVTEDWRHPPPLRYVVPQFDFAPGKVSAVQGFGFTAKTPFALAMAVSIAAGLPFLGGEVVQSPVLYLDHEASVLTQERATRICRGVGVDPESLPLHYAPVGPFSDAYVDELRRFVVEHKVGAVFVDTYSSAVGDVGFNESNFRLWADALGRVSRELDVLIVTLVHENKGAYGQAGLRGVGGHSSLVAATQAAISLARENEAKPFDITVRSTRSTRKGFAPFNVLWSDRDDGALCFRRGDHVERAEEKAQSKDAQRAADRVEAGLRMLAVLRDRITPVSVPALKREAGVRSPGGAAAIEAWGALLHGGVVEGSTGHYALSESGRALSEADARALLGEIAGFTRGRV